MNASVSQSALNDPSANNGVFAEGMNDLGEIVGYYLDLDDCPHGYLSSNGTMVALDHPAAVQGTFAASINNASEIVGYYYDADDIAHGFLYREGAFIAVDEPASVFGTFAETINDAGDVAGFYYDADSQPQPFCRPRGVAAQALDAAVGDTSAAPARKARRSKRRADSPGLLKIVEVAPAMGDGPLGLRGDQAGQRNRIGAEVGDMDLREAHPGDQPGF